MPTRKQRIGIDDMIVMEMATGGICGWGMVNDVHGKDEMGKWRPDGTVAAPF